MPSVHGLRSIIVLLLGIAASIADHAYVVTADEHALIVQYCVDCHGDDRPEAGIGLAGDSSQIGLLKQRKLWLRALEQIRSGDMPPADADQWTDEQRSRAADWLDTMLNPDDWDQFSRPRTPKPVTLNDD